MSQSGVPPKAMPHADDLPSPPTLEAFRARAHTRLDPLTIGYLESGAADQSTIDVNRRDFDDIVLRPHVLRDVRHVSTGIELLGRSYPSPVMVGPTGSHGLFHADAELATVRGAADVDCGIVLSAYTNTTVEAVGRETGSGVWMQVNVPPSRAYLERLADRISGWADALVVTVDTPVVGARESQRWDGVTLPDGLGFPMLDGLELRVESSGDIYRSALDAGFDATALEWLVGRSPVPVLVKGVLRGDDAAVALDAGAAGVIVSNHGGRNLDSRLSTISALPEVVEAVRGAAPVLLDGGVRRGTDVLKALALGADAVLLGRPVLWGLTVAGERGVASVLETVRRETAMAMALCGVQSIDAIDTDLLQRS